jgi:hypothetical protein
MQAGFHHDEVIGTCQEIQARLEVSSGAYTFDRLKQIVPAIAASAGAGVRVKGSVFLFQCGQRFQPTVP